MDAQYSGDLPKQQNYSGLRRTDIYAALTASDGYRFDVDPSSFVMSGGYAELDMPSRRRLYTNSMQILPIPLT